MKLINAIGIIILINVCPLSRLIVSNTNSCSFIIMIVLYDICTLVTTSKFVKFTIYNIYNVYCIQCTMYNGFKIIIHCTLHTAYRTLSIAYGVHRSLHKHTHTNTYTNCIHYTHTHTHIVYILYRSRAGIAYDKMNSARYYQYQAIVFYRMDQINRNRKLLPNVTLGYSVLADRGNAQVSRLCSYSCVVL